MKRVLLAAAVLFAGRGFAAAQEPAAAFIERARHATEKYQDQQAAIIDGYRRIGADFPGMGEHWIRIELLFDGKIDAEHPEFLTYISVAGKAKLLGVAYALPLLAGETPPDLPAKDAWHDHFRTVEDETALPHRHLPGSAEDEPRLAMLHAWIWSPNPGGVFAADNWAIPYLRLGLQPPAHPAVSIALALSLLTGGVEYFSTTVESIASPKAKQLAAIREAFARSRASVEESVRSGDMSRLGDVWNTLWKSVERSIRREARDPLRSVLPSW